MRKGSKQTPEAIEKNRLAHLGKKDSPETLQKKKESHLGERNAFFGKHHTEETLRILKQPKSDIAKQHMSEAKKNKIPGNIEILKVSLVGKPMSEEHYKNLTASLGSEETRTKMSVAQRGENNPQWRGGVTPLYKNIRESAKYYEWRDAVYKRDDYCDVITGERGNGNLNAHHITPFAEIVAKHRITTFEEAMTCGELWDVSNGITMIEANHILYHARTGKPE